MMMGDMDGLTGQEMVAWNLPLRYSTDHKCTKGGRIQQLKEQELQIWQFFQAGIEPLGMVVLGACLIIFQQLAC